MGGGRGSQREKVQRLAAQGCDWRGGAESIFQKGLLQFQLVRQQLSQPLFACKMLKSSLLNKQAYKCTCFLSHAFTNVVVQADRACTPGGATLGPHKS